MGAINKAFGTKIPTSVKIGGTSVGFDPVKQLQTSLKEVKKTSSQANTDWKNAGKGDVGKVVSTTFQQKYNLLTAVPRTLKGAATGTLDKENQKTLGSLVAGFFGVNQGVLNTLGTSSTFQREARRESANDWTLGFSKNFAGTSRGAIGLSNAQLKNEDRTDITQLGVKYAAIATVAYGGSTLFGGSAAPEGGAVLVESGAPLAGGEVVTSSAIAPLGEGVVAGSAAAPVAAAGGSSVGGWVGNTALAYGLLTGKSGAPTSIGDILTGGGINPSDPSGGFLGDIADWLGGGSSESAPVIEGSVLPEAVASLLPRTSTGRIILWSGVAVAVGILVWRKRG